MSARTRRVQRRQGMTSDEQLLALDIVKAAENWHLSRRFSSNAPSNFKAIVKLHKAVKAWRDG